MSRIRVDAYLRPATLAAAIEILNREGTDARIVAGGMDLVLNPPAAPTILVDLSRLGLSAIETRDGGLILGATVTLTEALEHPAVNAYLGGVVVRMLRQVASPLHRNLSTVGGALASARPWSDVVPLFLALGATVTRYDGKSRRVSLEEVYHSRGALHGSILTAAELPNPGAGGRAAFWKFARTGFDIALLNCACFVRLEGDRCTAARVVIGAAPGLAARVPACEERLAGERLDAAAIEAAARAAQTAASVGDDRRASAAYRRELVYVGVRRCLSEALEGGR